MSKRLLALVEVLMAVSIFCTGYASWSFAKQTSATVGGSNFFEGFEAEKNEVTVGLSDFGVAMTTEVADVGRSRNFQYKVVTAANGTPDEAFSNTSLSIWFKVDIDTMQACEKPKYFQEALLITCTIEEGSVIKHFGDPDGYGLGNWLTLKDATLYVAGYPNVFRAVAVSVNGSGQLEMKIPLTELYNLLLPCKKGEITEGSVSYLPVELVIDFTPTGAGNSDTSHSEYNRESITRPCGWRYVFSAQLTPNT